MLYTMDRGEQVYFQLVVAAEFFFFLFFIVKLLLGWVSLGTLVVPLSSTPPRSSSSGNIHNIILIALHALYREMMKKIYRASDAYKERPTTIKGGLLPFFSFSFFFRSTTTTTIKVYYFLFFLLFLLFIIFSIHAII